MAKLSFQQLFLIAFLFIQQVSLGLQLSVEELLLESMREVCGEYCAKNSGNYYCKSTNPNINHAICSYN